MSDLALALTLDVLDPLAPFRWRGITPDGWQRHLVEDWFAGDQGALVLAPRRVGKSACAACIIARSMLLQPGFEAFLVSPTEAQAMEVAREILLFLEAAPAALHPGLKTSNRSAIELSNRSRVRCATASPGSARGVGADVLFLDEAEYLSRETITAALPTIAQRAGRIFAASTPSRVRDSWFRERWHAENETWTRTRVRPADTTLISAKIREEARASLSAEAFAREFDASWNNSDDNVRRALPDFPVGAAATGGVDLAVAAFEAAVGR